MKRLVKSLALSIFASSVSSAAFAGVIVETHTNQQRTSTWDDTLIGQDGSDGGYGEHGDAGGPGESWAGYNNTFINSGMNTTTTSEPGLNMLLRGGNGGDGQQIALRRGAPGGAGGNGGGIWLSNSGTFVITTTGDNSNGIQLLTQGGTGGDGYAASGPEHKGGKGGIGGTGGTVTVSLTQGAAISTTGDSSSAIWARSLGGKSGNVGDHSAGVGHQTMYNGPDGGNSSLVTVTVDPGATLTTSGHDSHGIVASSISGDGGDGGSDDAGWGQAYGGKGGNGGTSGGVTLHSGATVKTQGTAAIGIVAQAISGSGGHGGNAGALITSDSGGPGKGGVVDAINVTNTGTVTTSGDYAQGIVAQSISGGGGVGGEASGSLFHDAGGNAVDNNNAGAISLTHSGSVTTKGENAQGIVAQSVGGGGGIGGAAGGMLSVQGGKGGMGGSGGDVTMTIHGSITTQGQIAHGVLAQSIGGSGGIGGTATSAGANVATAIGGAGGSGGDGGLAKINTGNGGTTTTTGHGAIGLLAQSIGGGGGAGGGAYTISAGALADISVAVGGSGGKGGNGGHATADVADYHVETTGDPTDSTKTPPVDAIGVLVQSIGGGGGNGGNGSAAAYAIAFPGGSENPAANIDFTSAFGIGGQGGKGGKGGIAEAAISDGSSIETNGTASSGVVVQSIGGGGGNGGDSSALAAAIGSNVIPFTSKIVPKTRTISVSMAMGGTGGSGGNGDTASMTLGGTESPENESQIVTAGDEAIGALVQSIGGGGGNGGVGNAQTNSYAASTTFGLTLDIGATGGNGGDGGDATAHLNKNGAIQTKGASAEGLVVQSIGGGGGVGSGGGLNLSGLSYWVKAVSGTSNVSKALMKLLPAISIGGNSGSQGGHGGDGGTVNITHEGKILTHGVDSPAIVAQSIGGGGGIGGSAGTTAQPTGPSQTVPDGLGGDKLNPVSVTAQLTLNVGGSWGVLGSGGSVTVNNSGQIQTLSDHSAGIIAQSIGAGGGRGGVAAAGAEANSAVAKAIAGTGGSLNVLGKTLLGYHGDSTELPSSTLGNGGSVDVFLNGGSIRTGAQNSNGPNNGFHSFGVLAQSIGGGGGIAVDGTSDPNIEVALGAWGGQPHTINNTPYFGDGGDVYIGEHDQDSTTTITTYGDAAIGIFAQSVGSGGGVFAAGSSSYASDSARSAKIKLGMGDIAWTGAWPVAGNGGKVEVNLNSAVVITTHGNGAFGIMGQSIGSGGGTVAVAPGTASSVEQLGSQMANEGSTQGNGGEVTIALPNSNFSIHTSGVGAHGVVAQSIGGGGGLVNNYRSNMVPTLTVDLPAKSNASSVSGNGGDIAISSYGTINTTGAGAFGILAQSIGGGGGLVVQDDGSVFTGITGSNSNTTAGTIDIDVHNGIWTTGEGSIGIWAQSAGAGGQGAITINLEDNAQVYGGTGPNAAGILVHGGNKKNQINVGAGTYVGVQPGNVQKGKAYGPAIKAVNGGVNVLNKGTIYGTVDTGEWGTVTNQTQSMALASAVAAAAASAGTVTNAGTLAAMPGQHAVIDGHLIQTDSGRIVPLLDYSNGRSGYYEVTGDAQLAGTIEPALASALPNKYLPVLKVDGTRTGSLKAPDSPLFSFTLRKRGNQNEIAITDTHFDDLGLTRHKRGVARSLEDVFAAGNPKTGAVFAGLDAAARRDLAHYSKAIGELSPRSAMTLFSRMAADASRIADASMSCPEFTGNDGRSKAFLTEGECSYLMTRGRISSLDGDADRGSSTLKSWAVQGGGQTEILPGTLLGGSLAYQSDRFSGNDGVSADGSTVQGAIMLKHQSGPWLLTGALFGNFGVYEIDRRVAVSGFSGTANANAPYYSAGVRTRAAYTLGTENFYVRPYFNVDLVHAHNDSFTESGPGDLSLKVDDANYDTVIFTPTVEIGGRHDLSSSSILRGFVSAGVSVRTNDEWQGRASFQGGSGQHSFDMEVPIDQVTMRVGAGLQLYQGEQFGVRVQYNGEFGSDASTHGASADFSYRF